jgi:hypothetical protein
MTVVGSVTAPASAVDHLESRDFQIAVIGIEPAIFTSCVFPGDSEPYKLVKILTPKPAFRKN